VFSSPRGVWFILASSFEVHYLFNFLLFSFYLIGIFENNFSAKNPNLQKLDYGALYRPICNKVSPLWEWLPFTIIAVRCRFRRKTHNFIGRCKIDRCSNISNSAFRNRIRPDQFSASVYKTQFGSGLAGRNRSETVAGIVPGKQVRG
jgi:hypothetical protein